MPSITAYPYLTAPQEAWSPRPWFYRVGEGPRAHLDGDSIGGWDYQANLELACDVTVDVDLLRDSVRMPREHWLDVIVLVDCPALRERWVGFRTPLPESGESAVECLVSLPPGSVAERFTLERQVVLREEYPAPPPLPSRKGSILLKDPRNRSVVVEGQGGRFPVEVVDLDAMGYRDALWMLDMDTSDAERAFLAAVRLYVNSSHDAKDDLLQADTARGRDLLSAMSWDVMRQLVVRSALSGLEVRPDHDEGTLGAAIWSLVRDRLGYDHLDDVTAALEVAAEDLESRFQSTAGLFR